MFFRFPSSVNIPTRPPLLLAQRRHKSPKFTHLYPAISLLRVFSQQLVTFSFLIRRTFLHRNSSLSLFTIHFHFPSQNLSEASGSILPIKGIARTYCSMLALNLIFLLHTINPRLLSIIVFPPLAINPLSWKTRLLHPATAEDDLMHFALPPTHSLSTARLSTNSADGGWTMLLLSIA